MHAIDAGTIYSFHGHQYGRCLDCRAIVDLGGNGPIIPVTPFNSNQMVTDNGNYILPNGIYIIVQEDLETYLNGALIFHPYNQINN